MINERPAVGWVGDMHSGGLTIYAVDDEGYSAGEGVELGHGIPTHVARELGDELRDLLSRIVAAQRGWEGCPRVLVGQGSDTHDPICARQSGHQGRCRP
jgi:hypothetical protein